jgi:hypothetical protein
MKMYGVPLEQFCRWLQTQLEGWEALSKAHESGDPTAIAKARADFEAAIINAVPEGLPEEVRKKQMPSLREWEPILQIMDRSQTAEFYRFQIERASVLIAWNEAQQAGDPL